MCMCMCVCMAITDRKCGHAQRSDVLLQHLVDGEALERVRRRAVGAAAKHKAGDLIQTSRQLELQHEAIESVGLLVDVYHGRRAE